jgi:hypothetical protein
MHKHVKPLCWPLRRRRLYDVSRSTLVYQANVERWLGDPSTACLLARRARYREALYVTSDGLYFLLRDPSCIKPLWRWQARCWLLRHAAPADVVRQHFPACFSEA